MKSMTFTSRRRWTIGLIAIATLMIITLLAAPQGGSRVQAGSSYSREPSGYGAWYAYMEDQGTPVQRWQKPLPEFSQLESESPKTLIQVVSSAFQIDLFPDQREWVTQGHTLILLGWDGFPTEAPFTSEISGDGHTIKLETTRRQRLDESATEILGDRFGAVVWQESLGKGRIIRSVSPFIGANAYQDEPGNFAFLANLVQAQGPSIWIDESRSAPSAAEDRSDSNIARDWVTYLSQTPFLPILVQGGVVMLVLIGAKNQRLGQPIPLNRPQLENSEAYIQALAGVLEKAERSDFVLDLIGHEEQLQVQRFLGLGRRRLDPVTVVEAWVAQTGRPAEELEQFLAQVQGPSLNKRDLFAWIQKIKVIRDPASRSIP